MHINYFSGAFNKLNRQFKYSNECQRLSAQRNSNVENVVLELLKETKEMKKHFVEYNYHLRMDTIDLTPYFPLKSQADVTAFMNNDQWENKRKARYTFINI